MGKLKQPKSLELLALEKSAAWLHNLGEQLIEQCFIPFSSDRNLRNVNEFTHQKQEHVIRVSHDLFERYVPYYLYKKLTDELMKRINDLVIKCKDAIELKPNMAKFHKHTYIAIRLSESLVSIKMQSVDFDEFPQMIKKLFFSRLHEMKGLKHLNLGSVTGGWKTTELESSLVKNLTPMHNLVQLSLNYDCTDKILGVLVRSCPKLVYLDITNSTFVTDRSVYIILELRNLRVIQLYRTNVTMLGYITLLLRNPKILDIGRFDELGICIEYINDYYPKYDNFKLEHFSSIDATTNQIEVLCEKFPNINSISIFHDEIRLDLMSIIGINKLEKLKLRSCDFYFNRVRDLLEVKGCNITRLDFEHVDQIDVDALVDIARFCPDLETFYLCNCNLLQNTYYQYRNDKLPSFLNLKNFTLIGNCSLEHLEYILSYAPKMKFVHLGSQVPTADKLFEKVFLKNELYYLEELRILQSYALTIKTAFMLVNNCSNLQRLNELESWYYVHPFQIDELKDYIRRHNLDIDLSPYKKYAT